MESREVWATAEKDDDCLDKNYSYCRCKIKFTSLKNRVNNALSSKM